MKSTVERQSESQVTLHVEIPAEVVDRKLDQVYRRVVQNLEIPGFRKGHVPRSFLEMRFGEDFLYADAQQELVEEHLPRALEEHDLTPAVRPELSDLELQAGQSFQFKVQLEVFPEVRLPDLSEVEVEVPAKERITNQKVEEALLELRTQRATLVPRREGEAVEEEDVVAVRQEGGETHEIQARSGGWRTALLGRRVGDRVELEPREGEAVTVTIEAVKRIELPDLEELAATLGYEDVESLRERVRADLKERADRDQDRRTQMAALDAVAERGRVIVPDKRVEETLEQEVQYLKQGREPAEAEREELRAEVERRLKRDRVLEAIKGSFGIRLSDEEFESFLREEAERREMNPVKFKALLAREGQLERLRREQLNRRALELLVKRVHLVKPKAKGKRKSEGSAKEEA